MYYSPMDGIYGDKYTCALLKENYKCIVYDSCGKFFKYQNKKDGVMLQMSVYLVIKEDLIMSVL